MVNNLTACGGTFDHFHKGHESFLNFALSLGGKLIVGLTGDEYIEKSKLKTPTSAKASVGKQNSKINEGYEIRKKSLEEFFSKEKVLDKIEIIKIEDLFGPTLSRDLLIDGIVVSDDTKKGADIINQKRKELSLISLRVFVAPFVNAEDGKLISSARIRNGEINRQGKFYVNPLWLKNDLVLPKNLREEFKKPFGELLTNTENLSDNNSLIITVGDATTKKFNENSIKQGISVVDFKIARELEFSSFSELGFQGDEEVVVVNNPAGHITSELFATIARIFKSDLQKRIILKIIGEDDLAVLPLILLSPLGTSIYYGQPNRGLVRIIVSEESKNKAYNLVSKLNLA